MGLTKTDLFSEKQNALSTLAKVLGHPARIAIIEHLLKSNKCINNELVSELGLAQATISQHLRELKSIGIIQGTIEGTSICYCINGEVWVAMHTMFNELFNQYQAGCEDHCC
ncbi:MAG: metalloregulator ArsR/SmtB family transcription factor [Salibacteraceae bacterium]